MTVHEVVGRVEMSGRQILMLEEDRDRLKSVLAAQDEILNQKISAYEEMSLGFICTLLPIPFTHRTLCKLSS